MITNHDTDNNNDNNDDNDDDDDDGGDGDDDDGDSDDVCSDTVRKRKTYDQSGRLCDFFGAPFVEC